MDCTVEFGRLAQFTRLHPRVRGIEVEKLTDARRIKRFFAAITAPRGMLTVVEVDDGEGDPIVGQAAGTELPDRLPDGILRESIEVRRNRKGLGRQNGNQKK